MNSCSDWRLYVIVDCAAIGNRKASSVAKAALGGGADVLQLRDKSGSDSRIIENARAILPIARDMGAPLIINDRADIAGAVGADGVHLGQDDLPVGAARKILGCGRIVGKSTHSLEQALAAQAEGADYIGIGPVFPTPTKPGYGSIGLPLVEKVASRLQVPAVCIGGIERSNIESVAQTGVMCIAVVRAVCAAPDPALAARELKEKLSQSARPNSAAQL